MTFVNIAPFGGYITGDQITETQINYWCAALPDAVDGAAGGSYTLTNPLIFLGDDVTIDEQLTVNGGIVAPTATITNLTIGSTIGAIDLILSGSASITGDVLCDDLIVGDDITVGGDIAVTGAISGRTLETATIITASASVDTAAFRNIILGTSAAGQTVTLTATGAANGDWFVLSNASGNTWNIAGVVTNTIADNSVIKGIRIGGVWSFVHRILS